MKNKILVIIYFLAVFVIFLHPVNDEDFLWHLKTGQYIIENREIPTNDPFSFPHENSIREREKFILSQYWLAQIIYYGFYTLGGLTAVSVFNASLFLLMFLFIWLILKNKGMYYVILFSIPACIILSISLLDSPQNFSTLFPFILLYLLEKYRRNPAHPKVLFFVPPLMLLWANLHGGYAFGVAIIIIYALAEMTKFFMSKKNVHWLGDYLTAEKLFFLLVTCLCAILVSYINPNDFEAVQKVLAPSGEGQYFKDQVGAYQSVLKTLSDPDTDKGKFFTFWWYFGYICIVVLFNIVRQKKIELTSFALIAFTSFVSLSAIRYVVFFVGITVHFIKDYPFFKEDIFNKKFFKTQLSYAFFCIITLYGFGWGINSIKDLNFSTLSEETTRPVRAAHFLNELPINGNIFNSYNKGSYLLWSLSPKYKIFFDNREIDYMTIREGYDIMYGRNYPEEEYKLITLNTLHSLLPPKIQDRISFTGMSLGLQGTPLWKERLDYYNIDLIVHNVMNIASGKIYPFILKLIKEEEWSLIYMDGNVVIFLRNKPEYQDIIDRYNKPKKLVYDEMIYEGSVALREKTLYSYYYSNIGFALIMKENFDKARMMVDTAMTLNENDLVAQFCDLYLDLLEHMKKSEKISHLQHF